jgi:hypothetical protein
MLGIGDADDAGRALAVFRLAIRVFLAWVAVAEAFRGAETCFARGPVALATDPARDRFGAGAVVRRAATLVVGGAFASFSLAIADPRAAFLIAAKALITDIDAPELVFLELLLATLALLPGLTGRDSKSELHGLPQSRDLDPAQYRSPGGGADQ